MIERNSLTGRITIFIFGVKKVGVSDKGKRGLREGRRNCLKYLKRGWNRKEEGGKDFKKEGMLVKG